MPLILTIITNHYFKQDMSKEGEYRLQGECEELRRAMQESEGDKQRLEAALQKAKEKQVCNVAELWIMDPKPS